MTAFFLFFLVSGFCGLAYEVVWLRLAMAAFGVNAPVVSTVLSVFMAGLGLGSWGGGRLSRGAPRKGLALYAGAELFIGAWALLVPAILSFGHARLSGLAWASSAYLTASGAWIAAAMLPGAAAMGATFPLAMGALRGRRGSERSFGMLYAANVLGAAVGVSSCAAFLIELLGLSGTLRFTALANVLVASAAWLLGPSPSSKTVRAEAAAPRYGSDRGSGELILWLFATGLVSMAMEMAWIRLFTPYLGTTVYAFAALLAVYLTTTFLGSACYRALGFRARDPGTAWLLLGLAGLLPAFAGRSELLLGPAIHHGTALAVLTLAPFCGLLGWLTPQWVDRRSGGDPKLAGAAYAANVLGSILGPLLAGFWLLPAFGEWATLAALSLLPLGFGLRHSRSAGLKFSAAALALALAAASKPDWAKLGVMELRRDYQATVTAGGEGKNRWLKVNGFPMTGLYTPTKMMAHLPLALLPRRPAKALDIAFGMGTTFRSLVSWGIASTVVDLVPSVPTLFGYFHSDAARVAASPSARIVIDDGRRFLERSDEEFDLVTIDPPPPIEASGTSLLYSREFYRLAKKRLSRGGVLQQWVPAGADYRTVASIALALRDEFPNIRVFFSADGAGLHFLASDEPLPSVSPEALASRLPPAAAKDLVEWDPGLAPAEKFAQLLRREIPLERLLASSGPAPALEDDRPFNEYHLVRDAFPRLWKAWARLYGIPG